MYRDKRIVALIPARGGSKGVKEKNIRSFAGKPLIAHSITEAQKSQYIDQIVVSTDSIKIAEVAKLYGAEVPFLRPTSLAQDDSKGIDVVLHLIDTFQDGRLKKNDYILLLQPTSPFRDVEDIDKVIAALIDEEEQGGARCLVSVSECEHHPFWANSLDESLFMTDFVKEEVKNRNRQEFPKYYRFNGALYIADVQYLLEKKSFLGEKTKAFIMPQNRSLDIDSEDDFFIGEALAKKMNIGTELDLDFQKYHRYLLERSLLGKVYRKKMLYPKLISRIKGCGIDIGCGIGDFLNSYPNCVGVDINPYNVEYCKRLGFNARVYDGIRTSFDESAFDFAILDNVLEHIENPLALLREVSRILKPKGTFIVGLPGKKGFASDSDHKKNYSDQELESLLTEFNFVKAGQIETPLPFKFTGAWLRQQCTYTFFYKA